jgi:drug/metabolite transporter (DMT)-like permease
MNHLPPSALLPGVVAGLAAAFFSALSYLVSRHHGLVQRALGRRAVPLRLLALAHVIMAAVCLPACVALWPAASPAVAAFALPLAASAGFYLLGQAALFAALGRVEASRIAPLLGLKIVMLAGIVSFVLGQQLDGRQWLAVVMSVGAALMLQAGHGAVPRAALGFVLGCSLCFAVSDLWIIRLITGLEEGVAQAGGSLGRLHAGVLAMALTYGGCGLIFAPLLGRLAPLTRADWVASTQYAAAWLGSMAGLYCCFGLVGVVFGNILQATRGPMSVVLGAALGHLGWHELEQRVDRGTFLRRFAAAVLMTVAIALYVIDLW